MARLPLPEAEQRHKMTLIYEQTDDESGGQNGGSRHVEAGIAHSTKKRGIRKLNVIFPQVA
jgi:hypothetical protein